jgi:hypothetical protein
MVSWRIKKLIWGMYYAFMIFVRGYLGVSNSNIVFIKNRMPTAFSIILHPYFHDPIPYETTIFPH